MRLLLICIALVLPSLSTALEQDPYEGWNRKVFSFNDTLDRYALKPTAKAYKNAVPKPVRTGLYNIVMNLGEPLRVLNDALQGKGRRVAVDSSRFLVNSTIGLMGWFDVATGFELDRQTQDFGITLARWGVPEGNYILLPFMGPSTGRSISGVVVDSAINPVYYNESMQDVRFPAAVINIVHVRSELLEFESSITGDRYTFIRDAWLQQRRYKVDGLPQEDSFLDSDGGLDDDLSEDW